MKLPFTAFLAMALLAPCAFADDSNPGTVLVPNNHGGYNVTQLGAAPVSIPFFGKHGYAAKVIAESHEKPKFILVPTTEDVGHGGKIVVYKKIYFATAEEAEAARLKIKN